MLKNNALNLILIQDKMADLFSSKGKRQEAKVLKFLSQSNEYLNFSTIPKFSQ